MGCELVTGGGQQQAVDGRCATGLLTVEGGVELADLGDGGLVTTLGLTVRVVVGQVGADHDQRLGAAPQGFEQGGNQMGVHLTDRKRQDFEVVEGALKEGQLHFNAMFFGVGAVVHDHPGHLPRPQPGFPVYRHGPEGGDEGLGGGQGHAAHRYPMGRTEDQHPPDGLAALQEFGVGAGRHGPGIDVAGVGHDQGLG